MAFCPVGILSGWHFVHTSPEAQKHIVLIRPSSKHCFALSVTVLTVVEWSGPVFDDDVIVVFTVQVDVESQPWLYDYKRDYEEKIQCSYVLDNGNPVLAIALLSGSILIIILIALASCKASFLDTLPVCQGQLLLRNRMQRCKVDNKQTLHDSRVA